MRQFSNRKLQVLKRSIKQLPLAGGYNDKGGLTTYPRAIPESARALPIGFWKELGLSLVLDLLATLITAEDSTKKSVSVKKKLAYHKFHDDWSYITYGADYINDKVNTTLKDFLQAQPIDEFSNVRYPGQGLFAVLEDNMKKGI